MTWSTGDIDQLNVHPTSYELETPVKECVGDRVKRNNESESKESQNDQPRRESTVVRTRMGNLELCGTSQQLQTLNGSVRMHYYGQNYHANNKHEHFRRGDIVQIPWCAPSLDDRNVFDGAAATFSSITGPICAKLRPAIILTKFAGHAIALPIFSHGGKGPSRPNPGCLPLRNSSSVVGAQDCQYNLISERFTVSKNSMVYVCKPMTIEWALPIKLSGQLSSRSWDVLFQQFSAFLNIGTLSVREQEFGFRRFQEGRTSKSTRSGMSLAHSRTGMRPPPPRLPGHGNENRNKKRRAESPPMEERPRKISDTGRKISKSYSQVVRG